MVYTENYETLIYFEKNTIVLYQKMWNMLYNYDNGYFIYFRKIFYSLLWKNYDNLAKTKFKVQYCKL